MDLHRIIAELQQEKERLDDAIAALEHLSSAKAARKTPPKEREPKSEGSSSYSRSENPNEPASLDPARGDRRE